MILCRSSPSSDIDGTRRIPSAPLDLAQLWFPALGKSESASESTAKSPGRGFDTPPYPIHYPISPPGRPFVPKGRSQTSASLVEGGEEMGNLGSLAIVVPGGDDSSKRSLIVAFTIVAWMNLSRYRGPGGVCGTSDYISCQQDPASNSVPKGMSIWSARVPTSTEIV